MKRLILGCLLLLPLTASAQTSLLPTAERLRAEYPAQMSREQVGELLNRIAWEHRNEGWGLLKKTGGSRCPVAPGIEASCDILIHAPSVRHFDVLSDSESAAQPVWRDVGPCVLGHSSGCDMSHFLAPVQPANEPASSPQPIPEPPANSPPPVDLGPIYAQIEALRGEIAELRAYAGTLRDLIHGQTQATETLSLRMQLLESRPVFTGCQVSFFGLGLSCRVVP